MSDPRIPKLIAALKRRFPETTIMTCPIPDPGIYDECWIRLLNAPTQPAGIVHVVAGELIEEIWGDDPVPVLVGGVSPENTAKYYAHHLPKPRAGAKTQRRRAATVPARRRSPAARERSER
jgi:hypothetical protein